MAYEVEYKFPLPDREILERAATNGQIRWSQPARQEDTYYNHPTVDFARTDEALRVRETTDVDGQRQPARITYKGPRLDQVSKTRQEIDLPLQQLDSQPVHEMLRRLGFRPRATVVKHRRTATITRDSHHIELSWDRVERVGDFLELECCVASESEISEARAALEVLAAELGCGESQRRSYLELLLDAD